MSEHSPFLSVFPGCARRADSCGGLDKATVQDVSVNAEERKMTVSAYFAAPPSPVEIELLGACLREDYGLQEVHILAGYPQPKYVPPAESGPAPAAASAGQTIYGPVSKKRPVAMDTLTLESGRVCVEGDVVAVNSRDTKKGGAVLGFDLTDRTSTIHVSRYFTQKDDRSVIKRIAVGDHLTVQGEISYNRFDDDMVLEPHSIVKGKRAIRPDRAEEKRVELHLHTRFSALDALTDPAAAVKRAADWGMPAIAVTDHGVAQAFPDMWKAGKKHGVKIIYGLEGYYLNDMDGNSAVFGKSKLPLDAEFVAFDIETTGLNAQSDRMTEIGAVIFSSGEIRGEFNTFVDPQMPIPANITELTGIRDSEKTYYKTPRREYRQNML